MHVMHSLWLWLLPELKSFPVQEQLSALKKAGETELDIIELLGVALALVAVTAATQYALPGGSLSSRFAAALVNFAVALPLIAVAVAPFHIRRLRRGLRAQRQLRNQHE